MRNERKNFALGKSKPLNEGWKKNGGEKPATLTPRPTPPSPATPQSQQNQDKRNRP